MSPTDTLAQLPPTAEFYNPEVGVVTLGEIRAATEQNPEFPADPFEPILLAWEHIALNPEAEPWVISTGATSPASGASHGSGSSSAPKEGPCK